MGHENMFYVEKHLHDTIHNPVKAGRSHTEREIKSAAKALGRGSYTDISQRKPVEDFDLDEYVQKAVKGAEAEHPEVIVTKGIVARIDGPRPSASTQAHEDAPVIVPEADLHFQDGWALSCASAGPMLAIGNGPTDAEGTDRQEAPPGERPLLTGGIDSAGRPESGELKAMEDDEGEAAEGGKHLFRARDAPQGGRAGHGTAAGSVLMGKRRRKPARGPTSTSLPPGPTAGHDGGRDASSEGPGTIRVGKPVDNSEGAEGQGQRSWHEPEKRRKRTGAQSTRLLSFGDGDDDDGEA